MINIYFLQHRRDFRELLFYFINRIKPANKKLLRIFLLMTHDLPVNFDTDIECNIVDFSYNTFNNFRDKFLFALEQDSEYFFKLDEDIIFSNHVWDYIIENRHLVKDSNIMTLSPIINIGVPSCDYFIDDFCTQQEKEDIHKLFLSVNIQQTAGKSWGVHEFEELNNYTTKANKWTQSEFQKKLRTRQTQLKGVHPMKIGRAHV